MTNNTPGLAAHKRGIVHVDVMMVDLPPKTERSDAIQSFVSQQTPIVRIVDSDGAEGVGYSYTIGTGGGAVISLLNETLAPALLGRDPECIEQIWRDLLFRTHATAVGAITSLALAAIDTALWDLRSRRQQLPLYQLLGGARETIPLYSTEGGWLHLPTEALVEDALAVKAAGFGGSKIKIGSPGPARDARRLRAVREAVGDEFEIMTDANQGLNLAQAVRLAPALEEQGIYWFEEPLAADDVQAHTRLAERCRVPIAVGESLYSLSQFKDYLASGACSVVQADVARVGGITPWLKIAHMAEAFNVPICPHFLMELHLPLVCAVPNGQWLEYIPQLDLITRSEVQIEQGLARAPQTAGLGIDWDWAEIEALKLTARSHARS